MLRYLSASIFATGLYLNNRSSDYSTYGLSGRRIMCDITQQDMRDVIDILAEDASDVIQNQKLSFVTSYSRKPNCSETSITIFASYGTLNPWSKILNPKFMREDISNKTLKLSSDLPSYLAPLQWYLEEAMTCAQKESDMDDIGKLYFDRLYDAEYKWQFDEITSGTFGHFDKCRSSMDDLSPELKQVVSYYVSVLKVVYKIYQHERKKWDTFSHIYHGPHHSHYKPTTTDSIIVSHDGSSIHTLGGEFNTHLNRASLPKELNPEYHSSSHYDEFYTIKLPDCDPNVDIKATKWENIRDHVFCEFQDQLRK